MECGDVSVRGRFALQLQWVVVSYNRHVPSRDVHVYLLLLSEHTIFFVLLSTRTLIVCSISPEEAVP
jgi:hypothetical protein